MHVQEPDAQRRSHATLSPIRLPPWLAPAYVIVLLLLRAIEFISPQRIVAAKPSRDEEARGHQR